MGYIEFVSCDAYKDGVVDYDLYNAVEATFDDGDVNPFTSDLIYYGNGEDQTTATHHMTFNNSSDFTIDSIDIVEYTDESGSNEKGSVTCTKEVANNQTTFTWKFTGTDVNSYAVKINVSTGSTKYTITYSIADGGWSEKVLINPLSPIEVEKGNKVTIQVTPLTGYYFSETDTCVMHFEDTSEDKVFTRSSEGNMFLEMDESYSTHTLSLVFTVTKDVPPTPVGDKRTNFFTIYAPTDENMKQINKTVFIDNNDVIGKFISYKKFWCDIPIDGTAEMKAGNYDFNFQAPVIHVSIIDVDCGSVAVNEQYHNVLDYSPFSRLTIFLPFIGFVDLDDKMAMNNTVRVNYRVDVLSGRCLAEIYVMLDETTESCIASYAGTIATDEPFMQGLDNYKGTYELMTSMQLGELTPFIIVNTLVPLETGDVNLNGLPVEEVKKVGECSGYIQYSFINASGCRGTDAEKTEIENLLKSGINVNTVVSGV